MATWWTKGVASAIQACQQRNSVFVILVEPARVVLQNPHPSEEPPSQMLSRLSTVFMHKITFSHQVVLDVLQLSQAICLKLPEDETDDDFKAFSVYFKLRGTSPNLFFVSPLTGQTLVHKSGFVSPKMFAETLISTTRIVSGRDISMPLFEAAKSASITLQRPKTHFVPQEHDQTQSDERPDLKEPFLPSPPSPTSPLSSEIPGMQPKSMKLPTNTKNVSEARLLARLPSGKQLRKTFSATTLLSQVRYWLAGEMEMPTASIKISTAFPRRVFDQGENPKMLVELGLVPSETLIVTVDSVTTDAVSVQQSAERQLVTGLRSRAMGALEVLCRFFRSFMADNPNLGEGEHQQAQADVGRDGTGTQMPSALQIERNRPSMRTLDDDENLLSNGNSTQYGWNPQDEQEE